MKTIIFSVLFIVLILGCSKDEQSINSLQIPTQNCSCEIKVYSLDTTYVTGAPVYSAGYGTDNENLIFQEMNYANFQFYQDRQNEGNYTWIGIQNL